ncbi:MAG: methyl-accepting chemotaxis protein [Elusimicrobia bacterium]|nr:methyl-accepting chemotaxis protein [Elusimicrobiota bacterium]
MMSAYKRQRVIVRKTLQFKYTLIVLIAMLVTAVTVGADFYYSLQGFVGDYLKDIPGIDQLLKNMNQLMYAKVTVLVVLAAAVSVLVSHKFVGPVFKLEKNLEEISRGNLTHQVHLRSGDELKHISELLNDMIKNFRTWIKKDSDIASETAARLTVMKSKLSDPALLEEIEDIKAKLEQVSGNWKIN